MNIRLVATIAFALVLSGCTVTLDKDSVVKTDAAMAARNITLPDKPTSAAVLAPGTRLVPEDLAADFGRLHTVRLESDTARPLVVLCGGNLFREESQGGLALPLLAPFGNPLLFDYPGYGASGGSGTRAEFAATERTLAARVEALAAGGRQVIFIGHSLGGGVCASLAATAKVRSALVLAGTFANYGDVKDAMLGWFSGVVGVAPADDLVAIDVPQRLANYTGPIVVVALSEDETIPFKASQKLAERLTATGRSVTFVRLEGSGHSRILAHPQFQTAVKKALRDRGVETGE